MRFRKRSKLLIGASSPVGYYYALSNDYDRPAPILESPFSYMLLYDELWFLTKAICPYNMVDLDFVHFVDEELLPKGLPKDFLIQVDEPEEFGVFPWEEWKKIISRTIGLRWNYDNHARSLDFGELKILPTPTRFENMLLDRYIATEYDMDLVENTANAIWSKKFDEKQLKINVSEHLVASYVASFQSIGGPWHPSIDDLRTDDLLKNYRGKIESISDVKELNDVGRRVTELSIEYKNITSKIRDQYFDTTSLWDGVLEFLIGLVPVTGNLVGVAGLTGDIINKMQSRKEDGWVGFLGRIESTEFDSTDEEEA